MVRTSRTTKEHHAGCSKRPFSKAAASEEGRRTLRYVELLSEATTLLAGFFSILLGLATPCFDQATESCLGRCVRERKVCRFNWLTR